MSRILVVIGLVATLVGALDPLEGSVVILGGIALVAIGAGLRVSANRRIAYVALILAAIGVGTLWAVSAIGGFGGNTGRPVWWALLLLPYPAGWVIGLIAAVRLLREKPRTALMHNRGAGPDIE